MDNDDFPRGYILTRREALATIGVTGLAILTGCSTADSRPAAAKIAAGTCIARPEMTEGPYFVDEMLDRADIRSDPSDGSVKPGAPLALAFNVSRLSGSSCTPVAGAMVDIWQCDHMGVYSDVNDPGFSTSGRKFLRGYQLTDSGGVARFVTIYPGAYRGRTVHIHFKIRSAPPGARGYEFTSQLFFDDALTDRVLSQPPYSASGQRTTRNADDGIFRRSGGSQLVLDVKPASEGYTSSFDIALQV